MSVPEYVRRKSGTMFNCHPPFTHATAYSTFSRGGAIDFRPTSPPLSFYREYPIHSFAASLARRASLRSYHAEDDSIVEENRAEEESKPFQQKEATAALFSTFKTRASTAPLPQNDHILGSKTSENEQHTEQKTQHREHEVSTHPLAEAQLQAEGQFQESSPSSSISTLPDLLLSTSSSSNPPSPTASHHEAITPGVEKCDPWHGGQKEKEKEKEKVRCLRCGMRMEVIVEEEDEGDDEDGGGEGYVVCACRGGRC